MKNKIKNLIIYGIGVIFLIGIIALMTTNKNSGNNSNNNGSNNNTSAYSTSILTAAESNFDFKTVSMANGNVTHEFEIKNEGTEPVNIEKVFTSCLCTTAFITDNSGKKYGEFGMPGHGSSPKTNIEINAGESIVVEAVFNPAAHGPSGVGFVQRSIYLENNSKKSPKIELRFTAVVSK